MKRLVRLLRGLEARGRDLLFRTSADRQMEDELRFHIDMETDKYVREGLDPTEARRRALVAFGGIERHRERLREGRRVPLVEPLWHDLRFGLRAVGRAPLLSLVATVTIALGIGATTTVFSVANAMLLRPLPIPGVDRMVSIQEQRHGHRDSGVEGMLIPYERYLAYRQASGDVFESLAAHRLENAMSLRLPDITIAVNGDVTSGNYFSTLRVRPVLGHAYATDDADAIVISHDLWVGRFGGDPAVIGRTVGLDGRTMTIVGVAPKGFGGAAPWAAKVWAPVGLRRDDRSGWGAEVVPIGRLRAGISPAEASARVNALALRIPPTVSETTVESARLEPLRAVPEEARGIVEGFFAMLLGLAFLVLLIAATNIAGVMLARGVARRREMAVRLAIGAGRARIVRHLLAESLLLFAAGGLLGIGLAYLGTGWISHLEMPPQMPEMLFTFTPDGQALTFAMVVTGVSGVLFGLAPALRASRPEAAALLKTGATGSIGTEGRLRNGFVGGQIALAATLLLLAALFVRSLRAGLATDLGFDPAGVVTATMTVDGDPAQGRAFRAALLERVLALPGVERAAWGRYVPLIGYRSSSDVHRADAKDVRANASYNAVDPDYFETLHIPIVAGRRFTRTDTEGAPRVVVINQALADRLWPGQNPVGRFVSGIVAPPAEVVGVTPTGRYTFVTEAPEPFLYFSSSQVYHATMALIVRAPGAETETLRALYQVVHEMDPDMALKTPARLEALVGTSLLPLRMAADLGGAFGLLGLLLAALGIYSVLAYQVARRTREIAVRRALGATSSRVVGDVVRQGILLATAGCVIGVAAGAGVAHAVRSFLFGVRPLDPVTFAVVPTALFVVTLLASWLPARRTTAVEPSDALKSE